MAEEWEMQRLEFHEGCRLKPYRCSEGKLTIGIGRNLDDNPLTDEERKALGNYKEGITKNGALMLLRNDIHRCKHQLKDSIQFYTTLDKERRYALLDMCFQLGICGLLKFKRMLKAMKFGHFEQASIECLNSKYGRQTPKRAKRIAKLIKDGEWELYI